jgi:hypothetical protein
MAQEIQIRSGWKRIGYDGTYFSVQRRGCCTAPKGGDYSSLRLLLQPIGRGRLKCCFTVLTRDWNKFVDVLEDGKKKGESAFCISKRNDCKEWQLSCKTLPAIGKSQDAGMACFPGVGTGSLNGEV